MLTPQGVLLGGESAIYAGDIACAVPGQVGDHGGDVVAGAETPERRDGIYHAYGIVVLTPTVTGIGRVVVFADPGLFGWFGLRQILAC